MHPRSHIWCHIFCLSLWVQVDYAMEACNIFLAESRNLCSLIQPDSVNSVQHSIESAIFIVSCSFPTSKQKVKLAAWVTFSHSAGSVNSIPTLPQHGVCDTKCLLTPCGLGQDYRSQFHDTGPRLSAVCRQTLFLSIYQHPTGVNIPQAKHGSNNNKFKSWSNTSGMVWILLSMY